MSKKNDRAFRLVPELSLACQIGQKISEVFDQKSADPLATFAYSLALSGIDMRHIEGSDEFEFDSGDAVVTGPQIGFSSRMLSILAAHAGEEVDPNVFANVISGLSQLD